jgi:aryl-phospho-beta-D-glucosidase BglC (GH1 family)
MRAHWENFYNETYIEDMAMKGIKLVRLPIGDWTINQYGPYVGCMDGAKERI